MVVVGAVALVAFIAFCFHQGIQVRATGDAVDRGGQIGDGGGAE